MIPGAGPGDPGLWSPYSQWWETGKICLKSSQIHSGHNSNANIAQTFNIVTLVPLEDFHQYLASNGVTDQSDWRVSWYEFFNQSNFVLYLVLEIVSGS